MAIIMGARFTSVPPGTPTPPCWTDPAWWREGAVMHRRHVDELDLANAAELRAHALEHGGYPEGGYRGLF